MLSFVTRKGRREAPLGRRSAGRVNMRQMMRVFVGGVFTAVVGVSCTDTIPEGGDSARYVLSLSPTPRSLTTSGLEQAFETLGGIATTVNLADPVDWWQAEGKPASSSKATADYAWQSPLLDQYGLGVFVQMDPYATRSGPIPNLPASIETNSFADPVLRTAFMADAVQRVELYRPKYLCLGMEINAYYEAHPDDFENFVSLFKETRQAVKEIDPDCLVFVSFQYELLLGGFDALLGVETQEPEWFLFDLFAPDQDAVGISSYPLRSLVEGSEAGVVSLPADYYSRIADHTDRPIVFAELGWPSDASFGGSLSSQADFIRGLPDFFEGLDIGLVNWYFLYDVVVFGPEFSSMGLYDIFGFAKPALFAWADL